jgi:hypothetical protein
VLRSFFLKTIQLPRRLHVENYAPAGDRGRVRPDAVESVGAAGAAPT